MLRGSGLLFLTEGVRRHCRGLRYVFRGVQRFPVGGWKELKQAPHKCCWSLYSLILLVYWLCVVLRLRAEADVPIQNRCGWMSCKCTDRFPLPQSSSLGSWGPVQGRRITVARCKAWRACPPQLSRVLLPPRAMLFPESSHSITSVRLDQSSLVGQGWAPSECSHAEQ